MNTIISKIDTYKEYFRDLFLFSLPIIIGNLAYILIGTGDVFVAAKHSSATIAAISIATSIFMSVSIMGIGLLISISPVLANFRGEKKRTKNLFMVSVNYSLLLAFIFCILIKSTVFFIDKLGFEPNLVPMIKEYIDICSYSVFGAYLYQALKEFLQSYEIVMFPNMVSIVAILINILLNFALVFGFSYGGIVIPELGIKGLAISSVIVRSFMGLSVFVYCIGLIKGSLSTHRTYLTQLLKVGYPISIALLVEFLGFNIVAILAGKISGIHAAAHTIVLSLASLTFMVPLAVSNAISVKVGYANGAKNFTELKRYSIAGISIAVTFMAISAIMLILYSKFFVGIFSTNQTIMALCLSIVPIAALFQIFDGVQVAFCGILRGLKTTKYIMIAMLCGYWLLGFPLGCYLAFYQGLELQGFWVGLAFSLFVISIILGVMVYYKFKQLKQIFTSSNS